jgi:hypothetical protein
LGEPCPLLDSDAVALESLLPLELEGETGLANGPLPCTTSPESFPEPEFSLPFVPSETF